MSAPPVSVVIPAHNAASTITRALGSVRLSTVPVERIVVVDDHSTDDTIDRVEALGDPSIVVVSALRHGAGHARNRGVEHVETPLLAFLDADDLWYPDKLEQQLPLLEDPQVVLVGGSLHYVGEHGDLLGTYVPFDDPAEATASLRRAETMPISLSSSGLMRTEDFRATGGFDETFMRTQDFELGHRLVRDGRTLTWPVGRALGAYMLHSGGVSATSYREQFLAAELVRARLAGRTTKSYAEWQSSPDLTGAASRKLRSGAHYRRAGVAVGARRWLPALAHGAAAVTIDPKGTMSKVRGRGKTALEPAAPPSVILELFRA